MSPLLCIDGVHQIFHAGDVNEVGALRGINLAIPEGQFVTIIGSNGAGKSTLFDAIAGVHPITRGRIFIGGVDVTAWPEPRRASLIGRVFQNPSLGTAGSMSIAQNLALALRRGHVRRLRSAVTSERRRFFQTLLGSLGIGLEDRLDVRVSQLSGGERQALTLLMATMAEPKILLLDEHTAALDPATAATIMAKTREIVTRQRLTTLMITHNMQDALAMGDRTLMIDTGRIMLDVTSENRKEMSVQDLVALFGRLRQYEADAAHVAHGVTS